MSTLGYTHGLEVWEAEPVDCWHLDPCHLHRTRSLFSCLRGPAQPAASLTQ